MRSTQSSGFLARRYVAPRDFEDNGEEILARCLAVLRETEKDFSGADLQDMLGFLMNKMFGEIGKRFESLSSDRQQQVVDAVRKFIEDLPEAQREKLRNEIGADQITDSYIRKAIVSGTLSTGFCYCRQRRRVRVLHGRSFVAGDTCRACGFTLAVLGIRRADFNDREVFAPNVLHSGYRRGGWRLYSRQNETRCGGGLPRSLWHSRCWPSGRAGNGVESCGSRRPTLAVGMGRG